MRGRPTAIAALAATVALSACGANMANEDQAGEATGRFPASVSVSFPAKQRLAEPSVLTVKVKNTGHQVMPDVAVTLTNPKYGSGAQALGELLAESKPGQPILAGRSRAVWVIDRAPGACGFSCKQGGAGAAVTAYTNTWALGALAPGRVKTFAWHVTALQPGAFRVAYRVVASPSGQAPATGSRIRGTLHVLISAKPRRAYVNDAGQVVSSH